MEASVSPTLSSVDADGVTLLHQILRIRRLEEIVLELTQAAPPAVIGSVHLCAGQEAVPVGALAGLDANDQIVATYRGHGWALASGLSAAEVLGEICHRSIGINGGRGGSAYMMAPERRFIGENSIVGAGLPIACGVALANRALGNDRIVAVSVGDGALNQGAAHEGLVFAAARNLPVLVVCENNGWSEMTATADIFRIQRIAQRASGYGIQGVTIDGTDPVAVRETLRQAAQHARSGRGPVLIECRVPRLWGHYNRDIQHYRSREDQRAAAARDPVATFSRKLIEQGVLTDERFQELMLEVRVELESVRKRVLESSEPSPEEARTPVYAAATVVPENRDPAPPARQMTFIQAVNEALRRELAERREVLVYGEDVGKAGGIFGACRQLQKTFGEDRVFDTPIAESAILGSAVGAAIAGLRPIVEIMWADFLLVALDQLVNQAANVRYVTGGRCGAPLVVRTQQGTTPGSCAQHSQCLEALLLHIPGLRVAIPATPQDAYDMLRSAVASPDPCVVIEARRLYQVSGDVVLSETAQPMGHARRHGTGKDVAIVTWGTMLQASLEAAATLAETDIGATVLDLRWLSPLDEAALIEVVKAASGKVIVAHEANMTGGFGAEIIARLHHLLGPTYGKLTPVRVAAPDIRVPASPVLQRELLPGVSHIVDAARQLVSLRVN